MPGVGRQSPPSPLAGWLHSHNTSFRGSACSAAPTSPASSAELAFSLHVILRPRMLGSPYLACVQRRTCPLAARHSEARRGRRISHLACVQRRSCLLPARHSEAPQGPKNLGWRQAHEQQKAKLRTMPDYDIIGLLPLAYVQCSDTRTGFFPTSIGPARRGGCSWLGAEHAHYFRGAEVGLPASNETS
jgi:hypothetical protein